MYVFETFNLDPAYVLNMCEVIYVSLYCLNIAVVCTHYYFVAILLGCDQASLITCTCNICVHIALFVQF